MSGDAARLESAAPRAVNLGAIERELARLWQEPDGSDAEHLSRACMSNLVILCDRVDQANAIARTLSMIVQQHPSRVLLLVARADDQQEDIDAFVSAQCYLGSGGRQICSEQVTVRTHADAAHRLPSIVRALVIGDLPTAVWWGAGSTPASNPLFDELADGADQVIYDSAAWAESLPTLAPVLRRTAALENDTVVADLAWQRLQPWLRFISCVLDPNDVPGAVDAITAVVVEHGARGLSEAVLLASWFAGRLGWQLDQGGAGTAAEATWTLRAARARPTIVVRRGDGDESLQRVTIRSAVGGAPVQFTFTAHGQGRFEVGAEGIALGVKFHSAPTPDDAALVALQLSELGRDPLFHETLGMATRLATK